MVGRAQYCAGMQPFHSSLLFDQSTKDQLRIQVLSRLLSGILDRLDDLEQEAVKLRSELLAVRAQRKVRCGTFE